MSHCLGVIDGKHITMKKPAHSGSPWHDYKDYFNMVLLAIYDAQYNFTAIDIGEYGNNNDWGVLLNSRMDRKFEQNRFVVLPPKILDGLDKTVLVGNEIFFLKEWLMPSDNQESSWPMKWRKFLTL